ncbi:MAG: nucleotide exchange factor GrpE [Clostridia bacterium]|nr:nucleotide exchange factor GrpE [Clostridia bacterium]
MEMNKETETLQEEEIKEEQPAQDVPEEETAETEEKGEAAEEKAEEKSEEAAKEEEDLNTKYMRLAADFQNFRRRTEKEKSDIYAFANEKIAVDLLAVVDNFDRAMEHAESSADPKLAEGMQLILKQLKDVLEKNNISEIDALGKEFDPNYHNAVMTEAAGEGAEPNTVTKVLQKGYILNKKVIRPAMVAVAQ